MINPQSAYAIVTAVIEVKVEAWGVECTLEQVSKQAIDSAIKKISKAFGCNETTSTEDIRLIKANQVEVRWKAKARNDLP